MDRGFDNSNIDGIVGEGTHKELLRALSGEKPLVSFQPQTIKIQKPDIVQKANETKKIDMRQKFGSVMQQSRETAKELLNQAPITTQVKREKRRLENINQIKIGRAHV